MYRVSLSAYGNSLATRHRARDAVYDMVMSRPDDVDPSVVVLAFDKDTLASPAFIDECLKELMMYWPESEVKIEAPAPLFSKAAALAGRRGISLIRDDNPLDKVGELW